MESDLTAARSLSPVAPGASEKALYLVSHSGVPRARYLNPNTGRFWTRDTFGGNPDEPLSLNNWVYCQNDPVGKADASGNWPSQKGFYIHQYAIDQALTFLSDHERKILKDADAKIDDDEFQTSDYSYLHAMSSPAHTVPEARRLANNWVRSQINFARKEEAKGEHDAALHDLGEALHTLQDSTSPAHVDFQYWDGSWGVCSQPVLDHVLAETYFVHFGQGDIYADALYEITVKCYAYFKSKATLPRDFFTFHAPPQPKPPTPGSERGSFELDCVYY